MTEYPRTSKKISMLNFLRSKNGLFTRSVTATTLILVASLSAFIDTRAFCSTSDILENSPKTCKAAFECWRSEPISDDGIPLAILGLQIGAIKRLDLRTTSIRRSRGAKCRCRFGFCMFYSISDKRFLTCQEF